MKYIFALMLSVSLCQAVSADQHVRGYVRKDGTYVAPYVRSSPNSTQSDNYSTKGNVNPYTGQEGTKRDTTYDNPYETKKQDNDSDGE